MNAKRICAAVTVIAVSFAVCACGNDGNRGNPAHSNTIVVQKKKDGIVSRIYYTTIIRDVRDNTHDVCLCRALGFRVSQVLADHWNDNVLRGHQIKHIETGWNTPGIREIFADITGLPKDRIYIAQHASSKARLKLSDNWFTVTFTDGKKMEVRATGHLYSARYLKLRAALQRGEKDLYLAEAMEERKKLEKRFRNLPPGKMFTLRIL